MIKSNVTFPNDFFKQEIRCDYLITKQMKEVWGVEIDLFYEFDRVCRKYNIEYFASGGTLLGAIRHKGFIPWDDDIDIMMFRDQYDKLCSVADKEFKHPYFFQIQRTDPGSLYFHAKLRNSNTTAIIKSQSCFCKSFNNGIFLDIFPMDNVPEDKNEFELQKKKALKWQSRAFWIASYTVRFIPSPNPIKNYLKKKIGKWFYSQWISLMNYCCKQYELVCKQYNNVKTEKIIISAPFGFREKDIKYREDFDGVVMCDFEFFSMPCCIKYDHALRNYFGNYEEFVKGTSLHGDMIFDVDKPYTEYLKDYKDE